MGSVDIAGKLKYDSDMGVDLTRKFGYVFNLNSYQTDKKKFVGIVGYVLADIIARTEVKSECSCWLASGLYPETRCKSTEQNLLAPVSSIESLKVFLKVIQFCFHRQRRDKRDVKRDERKETAG